MGIRKPEYSKGPKKAPKVHTRAGSQADHKRRRELIRKTVMAWYSISPRHAKAMANYLREVTKVEHSGGAWRSGKGYVSLRLPRELYLSLRKVFSVHAPDMEPFATDDSDIQILYEEFPRLMPAGNRRRTRKG